MPLDLKPGIDRQGTNLTNSGGWYDGSLVRFQSGHPEIMGGWIKTSQSNTFLGTARSLKPWTALDGTNLYGMGTNVKYYIVRGFAFHDVTPIRLTATLGTDPFTTDASGSAVVSVAHTSHGVTAGSYVTYSATTGPIDGIPASEFNAEHAVTSVTSANAYKITLTTNATSGSVAGGGSSVSAAYQINIGLSTSFTGTGYGAGEYGADGYGDPSTSLVEGDRLRLWSQDNFGEDLVTNPRDGSIYYYDTSSDVTTRMVDISTLASASDTPTVCRHVIMSAEDRHMLALGCNPAGSAVQDPMLIRWPDTESIVNWTTDTSNSAGSLRLSDGSEIITGVRTQQENLVWTDNALYAIRFLGPPFTFGQTLIATNTSIISPNAMAVHDNTTEWMGRDNFFAYDGRVIPLPSTVREYVFNRINRSQEEQVVAGINRSHFECIWFYPSGTSTVPDSYVVHNYLENLWYFGTLTRTLWIDRNFDDYPLAAGTDGVLYYQEHGCDDGSTTPVSAMNAYIESNDFELTDGSRFMFARRILPDVTFAGSTAASPVVTLTVTPRAFQGADYDTADASAITRSSETPVEQYTKQAHIRVRGRALKYKVSSNTVGVFWRDGKPSLDVRMDGRQ
jgi:hypothetical protein